jgi:hypothetical protein
MKPKYHATISVLLSGSLYIIFKSWALTIASLISGILIDFDHFIDYIIKYGFHFDIKKFLNFFYGEQYKKLTLLLHAWEWLILLFLASWITNWNHWVTGILIGFGQHIMLDRLYNISTFSSYSLIWRWKNRFDTNIILLKNRANKKNTS